jgi:hypothetical protein
MKKQKEEGEEGEEEYKSNWIFPFIYMGCIRYASTNKPP